MGGWGGGAFAGTFSIFRYWIFRYWAGLLFTVALGAYLLLCLALGMATLVDDVVHELPDVLRLHRDDGSPLCAVILSARPPDTLSWAAAMALKSAALTNSAVNPHKVVRKLWEACCSPESLGRFLAILHGSVVSRALALPVVEEVAAQVLRVRREHSSLTAQGIFISATGHRKKHPVQRLWARVTVRLNGNVRKKRERAYAERDRRRAEMGLPPKRRWLRLDRTLWHSATARRQWTTLQGWRDDVARRPAPACSIVDTSAAPSRAADGQVARAPALAGGWGLLSALPGITKSCARALVRRRPGALGMPPLLLPLAAEMRPCWTFALRAIGTGLRHDSSKRLADRLLMQGLGYMSANGVRLVNPARVASILREHSITAGQVGWVAAAKRALKSRRHFHGVAQAAPANISASAQLLYQCVRGRAEVVAVETYLDWMSIPTSAMLLRILRGQQRLGSTGRLLTPLQANAEVGSTMHVGVVSALIRAGWARLRAEVRGRIVRILVHSSFAGLINAGFLAVRAAFDGVEVALAVATEIVDWKRDALRLQFPSAVLFADAREVGAFMVTSEVMVVSWSCMPYSAAKHVPADALSAFKRRARQNTELVIRVLQLAAAAPSPPLLILLENVPGLVERSIYEGCRILLAAAMMSIGYSWQDGTLCPAALHMGPQMRKRWYAVGVREDAC